MQKDWSVSAITAGFLAVLISYAGPLVIFFQAASAAHISADMMSSWVWAISIGAGVSGILLSWSLKVPVVTAWSAPGTALLFTLFPAMSINEAVGAYIMCALVIFLIGIRSFFDKLIRHIPKGIAAGMMAGILFQFGVNAFKSAASMPLLAFGMLAAYIVFKKLCPRYVIILVLATGTVLAACFGGITIVIAAITAALCTGREAHDNLDKRYIAGIANGVFI